MKMAFVYRAVCLRSIRLISYKPDVIGKLPISKPILRIVANSNGTQRTKRFLQNDWSNVGRRFSANRIFMSSMSADNIRKEVDSISEKFSEAVELLNDARSSMGTIYFTDDMKDAEKLVEEVLSDFQNLLSRLNEKEKGDVQRTIGLKMEELKAQMSIIKDSIKV